MSSSAWKPQATTSPMKNVWLPTSTGWRTSQSTKAGAWSRIGAPVTPSWNGKPLRVLAAVVDLHRLRELPDDRRGPRGHGVQHEHPARGHQLVGERALLDADAEQLRLERHLADPVHGHAVAPVAGATAEDVQPVGHASTAPAGAACRTPPAARGCRSPRGTVRLLRRFRLRPCDRPYAGRSTCLTEGRPRAWRSAQANIGNWNGSRTQTAASATVSGRPASRAIWMLAGYTPTIVPAPSQPPMRRVRGRRRARRSRSRPRRWRTPRTAGGHPARDDALEHVGDHEVQRPDRRHEQREEERSPPVVVLKARPGAVGHPGPSGSSSTGRARLGLTRGGSFGCLG